MLISAVQIINIMRINEVSFSPPADVGLFLIGGDNGEGKSSIMNALDTALCGKSFAPVDPVKHGADKGFIRIVFDGGAFVVRRNFTAEDGSSTLEVRDEGGRVKSPQDILDKLIGARFIDPVRWLELPPPKQRAALFAVMPCAKEVEQIDADSARAYDRRREHNVALRAAEAEYERTPAADVGVLVDVAGLAEEDRAITLYEQRITAWQTGHDQRVNTLTRATRAVEAAKEHRTRMIAELDEALLKTQLERDAAERGLDGYVAQGHGQTAPHAAPDVRRLEIATELKQASQINAEVAAANATNDRRARVKAEVDALAAKHKTEDEAIAAFDARKIKLLAEAVLPVPGLGFDAKGVTLNGVPLSQASAAERLRIAIGMAIAADSEMRDIWIRDGSLLDDKSLVLLEQVAKAAKVRIWVERVGNRDPGALIIRDGRVLEATP